MTLVKLRIHKILSPYLTINSNRSKYEPIKKSIRLIKSIQQEYRPIVLANRFINSRNKKYEPMTTLTTKPNPISNTFLQRQIKDEKQSNYIEDLTLIHARERRRNTPRRPPEIPLLKHLITF